MARKGEGKGKETGKEKGKEKKIKWGRVALNGERKWNFFHLEKEEEIKECKPTVCS